MKEKEEIKKEKRAAEELALHTIKEVFEKEIKLSVTKYIKGDIRSGNKLEYEGSIVIIGNVNGGAEVIASENIIIIGALRGLAHAGAKGNKKALISASKIETTQLRIANIIKEIEKGENYSEKEACAYVVEDKIIIDFN